MIKTNKDNSRTITKAAMVAHIEIMHNIPKQEAERFVDNILDLMRAELFKGNKVTLHRIGTLVPDKRKAGVMNIGGKDRNVQDRIKIKFQVSRTIDSEYKSSLTDVLRKLTSSK